MPQTVSGTFPELFLSTHLPKAALHELLHALQVSYVQEDFHTGSVKKQISRGGIWNGPWWGEAADILTASSLRFQTLAMKVRMYQPHFVGSNGEINGAAACRLPANKREQQSQGRPHLQSMRRVLACSFLYALSILEVLEAHRAILGWKTHFSLKFMNLITSEYLRSHQPPKYVPFTALFWGCPILLPVW